MPSENFSSAAAQAASSHPFNQLHRNQTFRDRLEGQYLLRLSSLPLIYTRVVDRMLNGESVHSIARWLVGQSLKQFTWSRDGHCAK